jgi:hypothetical protein
VYSCGEKMSIDELFTHESTSSRFVWSVAAAYGAV